MAPEPNNHHSDSKDLHVELNEDTPVVLINEEDEMSSGEEIEENNSNTEYDGYKLLQQDETESNNFGSEDESDNDDECLTKPENDITSSAENYDQNIQVDIDYQNLTCSGFGEDFSTGLGFPEVIPDGKEENGIERDDNIEMNEEKAELVKNVMASFTLPQTNIPEWAKNLTDDSWKESLSKSVQGRKIDK